MRPVIASVAEIGSAFSTKYQTENIKEASLGINWNNIKMLAHK
jgi:hypothetical protein